MRMMTSYFEDFKQSMKQRMRIPVSLTEQYEDFTYVQAVIPRVRWLRPLGYELDVDQASTEITTLLAEEVDKNAKAFGTYDTVKSRVVIELKTTTSVKKKDKLVKKIKKKFGVGEGSAEEEEEAEEEEGNKPLGLTQGLGEDKEESAKEEEAKEAQVKTKATKRKATTPPTPHPKAKKAAVPAPKRPTTRATTQKAKEEAKRKKKTTKSIEEGSEKRRNFVAPPQSDEERTESDDNSQFKVVNHKPKTIIDKICTDIRNDDLKGLKNLNFAKLTKE